MFLRLEPSTFGRTISSTPSFMFALACAVSTLVGIETLREKAPREISQR